MSSMRVDRRSGLHRSSDRGWRRDRRGNVQIVETMIVGLLVVSAVVAVSTLNVPTTKTEGFKRDNERLVNDSLTAMLNRPSTYDSGTTFGSVLEEYVMQAIAGDERPLRDYLNQTLPGGAQYNVYLDNGYGRPYPVIENGAPPREAVAGSVQFVPALAYTFMVPEFALYHGDFNQNVFAVPVQNGVLLHDEGETVELAVEFREVSGGSTGEVTTMKTYGHTALRYNDPAERSWPSVEIYYPNDLADPSGTPNQPAYYIDMSDQVPYGDKIDNVIGGNPLAKAAAYNFTFSLEINETTGVKVPKNALITMDFPRGWDFNVTRRDQIANGTFLNNGAKWKDWTFTGGALEGWTVTAKLKQAFASDSVRVNLSANYATLFDTAYPFFNPVVVSMGGGVQGQSTILVQAPSTTVFGVFTREAHLSTTKPLISADGSVWAMSFTNTGPLGTTDVQILNITLQQPDAKPIIAAVSHKNGGITDYASGVGRNPLGTWKQAGPGSFYFNVTAPETINNGETMWLAFEVEGGYTRDNHYRNQDYLDVRYYYDPANTTSINALGTWDFSERAWRMGGEWVYRGPVPPADGDMVSGVAPGWPDQAGSAYWVRGGTYAYKTELLGNASYIVLPTGAASNTFGDYQGSHVFSDLTITNRDGVKDREFGLTEKVRIKNDFEQLVGKLTALDGVGGVTISDLRIRSDIYTPEAAWKHKPWATFEESVALGGGALDPITFMHGTDVNDDGVGDIIVLTSGGRIYAADGLDGTKFWTVDLPSAPTASELVDLNDDGYSELVVSRASGRIHALDTRASITGARELWTYQALANNVLNQATYSVSAFADVSTSASGQPDLAFTGSALSGESSVFGLDVTPAGTAPWSVALAGRYDTTEVLTSLDVRLLDIVRMEGPFGTGVAFASANKTVTLLDLPTLDPRWVTLLPETPSVLHRADLDRDGDDDLVVDAANLNPLADGGYHVYTLTGDTGTWAAGARRVSDIPEGAFPREGYVTPEGGFFAVGSYKYLVQDNTTMYNPSLSHPSTDPLGLDGALLAGWTGLHGSGNDVYIVDEEGRILQKVGPHGTGGGYLWQEIAVGDLLRSYLDVHVGAGFPTSGYAYRLSDTGDIMRSADGVSWIHYASACNHATTMYPVAAIDCGSFSAERWIVEEDASGDAATFIVLTNRTGHSYLYAFDVATTTWTRLAYWPVTDIKDIYKTDDGTWWAVGHNTTEPYIGSKAVAGSWTPATLFDWSSGKLDSVLVQDDGTGWAATEDGQVWRRDAAGGSWVPYPTGPWGADVTETHFVEDLDGIVWIFGDDYQHVPLNVHQTEAWAYFPALFTDPHDPGFAANTIKIEAIEGHEGGESGGTRHITDITLYYRLKGTSAWTKLTHPDAATEPGLLTRLHTASISCSEAGECRDLEVRAHLRSRTFTEGTATMVQDAGRTPSLRVVDVTLTSGLPGVPVDNHRIDVGPATLQAGSTAVYSTYREGAVLPSDRTGWTFSGTENDGVNGARKVAVTSADPVSNAVGEDIVIVEERAGAIRYVVVDGQSGAPEAPTPATLAWQAMSLTLESVLVMDADSDGLEDVVFGGANAPGTQSLVQVWKPNTGALLQAPVSSGALTGLVDLGQLQGVPFFAYGTGGGDLFALKGSATAGDAPTLFWTANPAITQGLATFEYTIPSNAMYGTAIVVSELTFVVNEGLGAEAQTARLVDWFHITPPERSVPIPPVYTVEIVSWFNEA